MVEQDKDARWHVTVLVVYVLLLIVWFGVMEIFVST